MDKEAVVRSLLAEGMIADLVVTPVPVLPGTGGRGAPLVDLTRDP